MNLTTTDLEGIMKIVFHFFNKHAPIKRKYIRANEAPFMSKDLHKAIMKRSKLRNKSLKSRNLSDRKNYTSQRNLCKKLLKNTKKTYLNNLDIRKVTDIQNFWKTVVPLFSNKFSKSEKINLTEGAEFSIIFSRKQLMSLTFQIFQTINLTTQMIHSKKQSDILKINLLLQI